MDTKMFCFQCQESTKNIACTIKGVCGKDSEVAGLQDVLMYVIKGTSVLGVKAREAGMKVEKEVDKNIIDNLFSTITNANFNPADFVERIHNAIKVRDRLKAQMKDQGINVDEGQMPDAVSWSASTKAAFEEKARTVGVPDLTQDEDIRSLRELITYGVKGIAAYADHASNLGYQKNELNEFVENALAVTLDDSKSVDELVQWVLDTGKHGVDVMSLLDEAHTSTYGHPEITEVNLGTRNRPGILISGHDLRDMEDLLEQTKDTGVDVYTHSEMLPAHYYPAFKKYDHFVGNYGNSWWKQTEEFETFNGPVLFTTNCLVPPRKNAGYTERVYTTGATGYEGFPHISERKEGKRKDFSQIIEHAKKCDPPQAIEEGTITGGFAHNQVMQLADKVVDAVKSGAIRKFFVMAGCDGRFKSRDYYTQFADQLPNDTVILTAGCAKYRYNKLNLGDIGGIPRVLDAGQCNDSFSLATIALKLKEVFELNDINELPIEYNIAWYEQKAVIVLLALLYLGVKDIKLGPTLPAFLSPNVASVLVDKFGINGINTVEEDIKAFGVK